MTMVFIYNFLILSARASGENHLGVEKALLRVVVNLPLRISMEKGTFL